MLLHEMIKATRKRKPKASVGREGIIITAERLFGEFGIGNVSLRQIAIAAGLANHFAVQYHFKDRETLVRAILELRLPLVDNKRRLQLEIIIATGKEYSIRHLFDCICRPILDISEECGNSNLASLIFQVTRTPMYRDIRDELATFTPVSYEITRMIERCFVDIDRNVYWYRYVTAFSIVLDSIVDPSLLGFKGERSLSRREAYDSALSLALDLLRP